MLESEGTFRNLWEVELCKKVELTPCLILCGSGFSWVDVTFPELWFNARLAGWCGHLRGDSEGFPTPSGGEVILVPVSLGPMEIPGVSHWTPPSQQDEGYSC